MEILETDQDTVSLGEDTFIEGIGDEIVHLFIFCIALAFSLAVVMYNRWQQTCIHPDNQQRVNETRQRINRPESSNAQPENSSSDSGAATQGRQRGPRFSTETTCPVCLNEMQFATETNCGHVFCGDCLITYWRHGNWLGAINCPVCRQQVTILFPVFQEDPNSDEARNLSNEINGYNRRFSGEPRPLVDYIYDLPTILRHAFREVFSFSGLVLMFRIRIIVCFIAAILYFVSPLDIIPEAAFGIIGFLDDFFVLFLLAIYISIIYRGVIANRGG